jgi:hypothetical protein
MRTLPNDAHFHADMATGCNAHSLKLHSADHHAAEHDELAEAQKLYRQAHRPGAIVNQHAEFVQAAGRVIHPRATAGERLASIEAECIFTHRVPGQEVFGMMTAILQKAAAVAWLRSERVRLLAFGGFQ